MYFFVFFLGGFFVITDYYTVVEYSICTQSDERRISFKLLLLSSYLFTRRVQLDIDETKLIFGICCYFHAVQILREITGIVRQRAAAIVSTSVFVAQERVVFGAPNLFRSLALYFSKRNIGK